MEGLQSEWENEVKTRLESLKCRACGGTNPYVCACAKKVFFEKKKTQTPTKEENPSAAKKPRTSTMTKLGEEMKLEKEWIGHKHLVCSPNTNLCDICNTGEWMSFCPCAKKRWMEWKKAGGWDSGLPLPQ
jgi:hypothetical protein